MTLDFRRGDGLAAIGSDHRTFAHGNLAPCMQSVPAAGSNLTGCLYRYTVRYRRRTRQAHREPAAGARPGARCGNVSTMQGHDGPDQRQADAEPALRPVGRARGLREQVEYLRQQIRVDADAIVFDIDDETIARSVHGQRDGAAFRRVLGRVVEQVDEYLDQAIPVTDDGLISPRLADGQRLMPGLQQGLRLLDGALDNGVDIDDVHRQFHQAPGHA